MADRPGTMIYFDILNVLDELTDEQVGQLFRGALKYAKDGDEPHFTDPFVRIAWVPMRDKLDRDSEKYGERKLKNKWVRYCGVEKAAGRDPLPFDEWRNTLPNVTERDQTSTNVNERDQLQLQPEPEPQLQPEPEPEPEPYPQLHPERKGVQGGTQTGAILHEIPQPYRPPDAGEWERLKAEQTAKLKSHMEG